MQLLKIVDFTRKDTEKAMRELMNLKNPPTGIFTFKSEITLDAILFLKRKYLEKLDLIDFTGNDTEKAILDLMNLKSPPTAIFTFKREITWIPSCF